MFENGDLGALMRFVTVSAITIVLMTLGACNGGGGSGTVVSPVSGSNPAPAPSPSPSPSPVPTPTPTAQALPTPPIPSPTPTPTPTSSPTPAPTPTPAGTSTLGTAPAAYTCPGPDTQFDRTFTTANTLLQYSNYGAVNLYKAVDPTLAEAFSYANASQRYTIRVTSNPLYSDVDESTSFGPGDVDSTKSNARTLVYSRRCYPGIGRTSYYQTLEVFRSGSTNDLLALTYASFGLYTFAVSDMSGNTNDRRYFAFGEKTAAANLPRSGVVTYNGVVSGRATRQKVFDGPVYAISGTVQITVDFVAQSFSGTLTLKATALSNLEQNAGNSYDLTIPLTQTGGASLTQLIGSAGAGSFAGFLAGPAGEELGGSFSLQVPDPVPDYGTGATLPLTLVGAAAAKR